MIIDFPQRSAPVCGCGSINTTPRWDDSFGRYFICEDCDAQLDTDGSRI